MKNAKIKSLREIAKIAKQAKDKGLKVVTTNGCFDILHIGHVKNLEWARRQGDLLIVGVNSDASVRVNKGQGHPIVTAKERALVLASLAAVDYVFIFKSRSPIPWLKIVKPAVHVKGRGSEKSPAFLPEERVVKNGGGKVVLAPQVKGRSTTNVIQAVLDRYSSHRK
jgi:rfaE bifunctional protein nucleotidyltransferase chain/domain